MSAPPSGGGTPIENRRQLIEYFAAGNKPRAAWRMGTEHEKFGFDTATLKPLPYDGEHGVRAMLEGLTRFGWEPVTEGNNTIALQRGKASITLEPGGQFELSGAPLETLHETAEENDQHLARSRRSRARSAPATSAWASRRNGSARTSTGCPRAATRSCASTCPRRASSAST